MFAKLNNGQLETYPYTLGMLRKDNPNVSFPRNISNESLSQFNVVRVLSTPRPEEDHSKNFSVTAEKVNGSWVEKWISIDASPEEIQTRTINQERDIRSQRDNMLAETDWRFRSDMNPSQEWINYCQALRDIPAQEGFPWNVVWPEMPE